VHDTPADEESTAAEEQQHLAYHTLSFPQVKRDALAVVPAGKEACGTPGSLPPGFIYVSAGHAAVMTSGRAPCCGLARSWALVARGSLPCLQRPERENPRWLSILHAA
jgi:hypothetical protein